jgi:ATP-dependent Clp protease ATP-binding subunit ClpC
MGTEHLLLGLLRLNDPLIEGLLASLHVSSQRVVQALDFVIGRGNKALLTGPTLSGSARAVLQYAEEEAARANADRVTVQHLLLGILSERDGIAVGVLESFEIHADAVRQQLAALVDAGYDHLLMTVRYQALYETTPTLNQVSRDLTLAALHDELDPMIGREAELERTMQILSRRTKNNPVLIGPAGVGKTAIAEGLALCIVKYQVPEHLQNCRVVALDVGLLAVGTKFRGDFEERLMRIMQEIVGSQGMIIVIDELHTLVRTGVAEGSIDASNLFKPMLARGEFQCIGATTLDEYRKTIEADAALERRFQPVQVSETSPRETLDILHGLLPRYERFHHVSISEEALVAAVQMSSRYIQARYLPDKAIDLVDEAAARVCVSNAVAPAPVLLLRDEIVKMQREKEHAIMQRNFPLATKAFKYERELRQELWRVENDWYANNHHRPVVTPHDIAKIVAMWTGIPVCQIAEQESQHLLKLEEELHKRVIGQHEAVQAIARAIRRSRTNVRDSRRPIGSFLFVGPTGVGKTELARALAATLFGDEMAMLKLDMSEFMESHSVSRLIGTPPGYVGYDQAGQLTEAVRRRPYSVVLFDEIEKAHPRIFDLLLQLLEDGCLTDTHGQTVDFKHTIIIITSNIGTTHTTNGTMAFRHQHSAENVVTHELLARQILPTLKDMLRPELINRIDEVVMFHPLEREHLDKIVRLMIEQTRLRLTAQSIDLHWDNAVCDLLVKYGYDRDRGARPLRRIVQRMLEDMLAETILQGRVLPGDDVFVSVCDDQLCVNVLTAARTIQSVA